MITEVLNSVIEGSVFSGNLGDLEDAKISQNPVIGNAIIISEKMLKTLKEMKTSNRCPAENKIMPTRNSVEAPCL